MTPTGKQLFNVTAALIRLKKFFPAFSSSDFTLFTSSSVKQLYISHSTMNVAVFGNFDVSAQNYTMNFQNTGKWYEFFSGDSLNITNTALANNTSTG